MRNTSTRIEERPFGRFLQNWRRLRKKSQLDLAMEAEISARHLSFLETGRSQPSREMVLLLANALDVPLRERNSLLMSAGYAPVYRESDLNAAELAPARAALACILRQQEPYPAIVMNRHWDIISNNEAARRFFSFLLGDAAGSEEPANVIRLMFHPQGLRPYVSNWESVAEALIQRVHRELVCGVPDDKIAGLLEEVLSYPGVPHRWRAPKLTTPLTPLVPVEFRKAPLFVRFFSTVTTLGTPQDITLQELRIECFFPVDAESEGQARLFRNGGIGTAPDQAKRETLEYQAKKQD